jgi:hypothetical protein
VSAVKTWMASDDFWAVLAAYWAERGDVFAAKNDGILRAIQANLQEMSTRPDWIPDQNERAILELSLKRAGQLKPDGATVAVQINAGQPVGESILAALDLVDGAGSPPEPPADGQYVAVGVAA